MSRKKKALIGKPKIHNSEFMMLKNLLRFKASTKINRELYKHKDNKSKFWFPYVKRAKPLYDMCGKYVIEQSIPDKFIEQFVKICSGTSGPAANVAKIISELSNKEFVNGVVSSKTFKKICKAESKFKVKVKKPRLVNILSAFSSIYGYYDSVDAATREINNRQKLPDFDVYITCDPYDIARMGGFDKNLKSCMNIKNGQYADRVLSNLEDPNMAIVYVKDNKIKNNKNINSIASRVIIRLLYNEGDCGIVVDRLYGNQTVDRIIGEALGMACKKANVNRWDFATRKHSYGYGNSSQSLVDNTLHGREVIAVSNFSRYRKKSVPYSDQGNCGALKSCFNHYKRVYYKWSFRVVRYDEKA